MAIDPTKRVAEIEAMQAAFQKLVSETGTELYERLLASLEKIYNKPLQFAFAYKEFEKKEYKSLIEALAEDLITIGTLNNDYFAEVSEFTANKFNPIKKQVGTFLLDRIGLTSSGKAVQDGFIDLLSNDKTVQRTIQTYVYNAKASNVGLKGFQKGLKQLLVDSEESIGEITRFANTFAIDLYQQADREIQLEFSNRLELDAFLYAGGLIESSRPFCKERNGKVFLKSEGKQWEKLDFAGKGKNYVWTMLGHNRCRHTMSYLNNRMAMQRRKDLAEDENGKLYVKQAA